MTTIPSTTVALTVTDAFHPSESELDFVVRTFNVRFSDWRGKRIVLHGTREYARAIVESFDEAYRFAAVVADGFANATFAGKDVWTDRQLVEEKPDLVILTERVRHAEAVYQEIGTKCREAGIALFDMYGLDWLAMRDAIDGQGAHTLEEWVDIAAPYDIVSFEVPDCLMMPNPQDADVPLICQPSMRKLIKRIVAQGKQALFVGRKPYTAEEQIESLIASGLISRREDAQDLFFMRANEDGAWRTIRAAYPDARILHVGYGIPKECVLPRYYGVNTYRMVGEIAPDSKQLQYGNLARESLDPAKLKERLEAAIEQAEVVSFDVFDTLLVRTTLIPDDVLEIVEQRAVEIGLPAQGFAAARLAAQHSADGYTAARIYQAVQHALGCSDAECEELYRIELEVERESIFPRDSMCSLLHKALARGKTVVLISDMYHSAETMVELLQANGITGYQKLLVSSEQGILKRQGLFDCVISPDTPANHIVHIGDSVNNDIVPAKAAGMQAIFVPSPLDLALTHGINRMMRKDMTLEERCELQSIIVREYADPFVERNLAVVEGACESIPIPSVASFCSWMSNTPSLEKAVVHVAPYESRIPVELRRALLAWYPFHTGSRALFLGSDREAFTSLLEAHYSMLDFELAPNVQYDFIVALDVLDGNPELQALAERLSRALAPDGVLLLGFRNRFGVKYLCGAIDDVVENPFATFDSTGYPGTHGRHEMQHLVECVELSADRLYYIMPDAGFAQAIYTDDYIPSAGIHDRVMPFDKHKSPMVAVERDLYPAIVEEGMLPAVANYYLMECRKPDAARPARQVAHVALSLDRGLAHSFITTLFTDGTALKAAAHPEGRAALEALYANSQALHARGLVTVETQLEDDGLHMPFIKEQPLLAHLDALLPIDPDAFIAVFDQLYEDVLASSEPGTISDTDAWGTWHASATELSPILQTAYIDMVPYNSFWSNGILRFFDQEFTVANCPAKYVLFRALRYTWIHLPHAEQLIPLERMKKRFGLEKLWDDFLYYEERFVEDNRNRARYRDIYEWARFDARRIAENRHALAQSTQAADDKPYRIGLLMGVFDLFHVGHLRLIKRAKARCQFLRVAVLSDDLVRKFKNITPTIPLSQRMEIIAAIDGVDEVVAIEDEPSRLVEWHRRPFDCFFSGDDYAGNEYWAQERIELEKLGATIEFFSYTEEQSSSKIRDALEGRTTNKRLSD